MAKHHLFRKFPVLPLVLGVSDGILTTLTLAAGAMVRGGGSELSLTLALRVGAAAFVTAAFTMFVAFYAEARSHLVRASRELNLTQPGRLAATRLGRAVLRETIVATATTGIASFVGAVAPLLLGALVPMPPWMTLVISVALLGAVGWRIGAALSARKTLWLVAMLAGGCIVTIIGAWLDIA